MYIYSDNSTRPIEKGDFIIYDFSRKIIIFSAGDISVDRLISTIDRVINDTDLKENKVYINLGGKEGATLLAEIIAIATNCHIEAVKTTDERIIFKVIESHGIFKGPSLPELHHRFKQR